MPANLVPFMPPLPLSQGSDVVDVDLDVSLSTPHTMVVQARLETAATDAADARSLELALVIPRSQCCGERPRLGALLDAARAAVARATRAGTTPLALLPRRVVTLVAGRPHLIPLFD